MTDKFTDDVILVQKEYKMREIGHTNRNDAIAIAKTLHTGIEDNLRQTIVINNDIILGLFNTDYAQTSFHFLHHELCHIHDNYYQHIMFSSEARAGKGLNELEHILVYNADPIWSEYIAVRLSSSSTPLNSVVNSPANNLYLNYLLDQIDTCKKNLQMTIEKYRVDGEITALFIYFQEETSLLLKIAATTQGYIDGLNLDNHEASQKIDDFIKQTYFYDTWIKQRDALRALYKLYPDWNDVYQLQDLGEAILTCWRNLGIYPEYIYEKDRIHVDVPFNT